MRHSSGLWTQRLLDPRGESSTFERGVEGLHDREAEGIYWRRPRGAPVDERGTSCVFLGRGVGVLLVWERVED